MPGKVKATNSDMKVGMQEPKSYPGAVLSHLKNTLKAPSGDLPASASRMSGFKGQYLPGLAFVLYSSKA